MDILEFIRVNHKLPLNIKESDMIKLEKDLQNMKNLKEYLKEKPAASTGKKSRIKKGIDQEGNKFDSKWEYAFYIYTKYIENRQIIRNKTEYLTYINTKGKQKRFYPDFKIDGTTWVEIKGYWREDDNLKQAQNPQVEFYSAVLMRNILSEVTTKFPDWQTRYITQN